MAVPGAGIPHLRANVDTSPRRFNLLLMKNFVGGLFLLGRSVSMSKCSGRMETRWPPLTCLL